MSLFEHLTTFFEQEEWPYNPIEGQEHLIQTGFSGREADFNCVAQVSEEANLFVFYSIFPVRIPEGKLYAAAEYLMRANYGLVLGNFELDFDDGEVRFKTSVDAEDVPNPLTLIKNLVYANIMIMDRYHAGLMSVIYSPIDPAQAIASVEDVIDVPDEIN